MRISGCTPPKNSRGHLQREGERRKAPGTGKGTMEKAGWPGAGGRHTTQPSTQAALTVEGAAL